MVLGLLPGAPDERLYIVWCGDGRPSYTWIGPGEPGPSIAPVVDELVHRVELLSSGVQVRPDGRGVTGIPSMFWVEGPGAAPASESVSAFGLTVTVSFALAGVTWDFGDGTPVQAGGLGEAWPQRSSVQHTYRDPSGAGGYSVTALLTFQPSFTVNGVGGEALAPIQVPATRQYEVREVQAVRRR